MILPEKHVKFSESLIGLGAFVLKLLSKPKTVDTLWQEFQKINNTNLYPAYQTIDNFILCLDLLYILGIIEMNSDGGLYNAINKASSK